MPLSEELKAIIGEKATEEQIVEMLVPEATKHLETKGHIIRTKEDEENYINVMVEERIKPRISEIHKKYDDDIFEILGERKQPTQKTYDFAKQKLAELKAKADLGGGKGDQVLLDKIKGMEETIASMKSTHEKELSTVKQKAFNQSLNAKISGVLENANFAYPAQITTDEQKAAYQASIRQLIKTDFIGKYTAKEDDDGNIVFYLGETLQVSSKDGKPLTEAQLIAENYTHYFSPEEKKKGGAGSGKDGIPTGGFTTKEQVYEYLKAQGMSEESKAYSDKAVELIKKYGLV